MENVQDIFRKNGYSLKIYPEAYKSFYYCVYSAKRNLEQPVRSRNASQMRKEIFEFERKNAVYFHLFQPKCFACDGNHCAVDCLNRDLEKMYKEKMPPSPRECFAAADLLQRCICIVRCNESSDCDIHRLKGYIFAPTDKKSIILEPVCILMLEKEHSVLEFANICLDENIKKDISKCPGVFVNKDHKHCFGLRFANELSLLFGGNDFNRNNEAKDLYRHLSLEFYGTEEHHKRIINIVCNFELEVDNVDMFCKYVNSTVTEETSLDEKKSIMKAHVEKVQNGINESDECEFYALSSVYNIDIIVGKTANGLWEMFVSLVCKYSNCFDSPVILIRQGKRCYFSHKDSDACSCCQKIPEIPGHIGDIKANIHKAVLRIPCCSSGRHSYHKHIKNIPNITDSWPEVREYLHPTDTIQMVINRLEEENRRLDQINGGNGSLEEAIAKELFGNENQCFAKDLQDAIGKEDLDMETTLQKLSKWLKVPIYVYCLEEIASANVHQTCLWTIYEPADSLSKSDCRFYITLFYNKITRTFDRITPVEGCNCQNPPPLSFLRNNNERERDFLKCVLPEERHYPLVTFLTEEPETNKFENEIRDFPVCSSFSPINIAEQRQDMTKRTIDCVECIRYSLLRCLSKEIFGTEKHFDVLIKELSNELMQNITQYLPFIGEDVMKAYKTALGEIEENRKGYEKFARFIQQRIEDDLPCGELLLWLACSFFQTPIYVLRITDTNTSSESYWTEYAKVRIRRRDRSKKTNFAKKCFESSKYYVALLDTGHMEYHRIVPKQKTCNCKLEIPKFPDLRVDSTPYHTQLDCRLMRQIRNVDRQLKCVCILLDEWLFCNQMLQQKCDELIFEIEDRRKDVNIATITGTSAGIVGAALTGVGLALAPITAGISTLLSVGGAVLAVSGGTVATGAKITESVLNKNTIDTLKRNQNCYQERSESLKIAMLQLREELKKLGEISSEMQAGHDLEASDFAGVQSIPGVVRAVKGLLMIPLSVLKISSRGILILGAIIGPITAIVDATLLAFSAYNMAKGNKTDVTENLRRVSASLYGSRRQMHNWAYGNQKPFTYA